MLHSRDEIKKSGDLSCTDKITHHGYERFYSDFLNTKNIKNDILEIGYGDGESIKFWNYIFPNSFLNIIDKDKEEKGENYEVYKCDQSSTIDLNLIIKLLKEKRIELIVDDGSHIPEHQILTFNIFFNAILAPGFLYIIEDIEASYWKRGRLYGYKTEYGISSEKNIINSFMYILHWINREFSLDSEKSALKRKIERLGFDINVVNKIKSISFGHNIICITKKEKIDYIFDDREYRVKQFL